MFEAVLALEGNPQLVHHSLAERPLHNEKQAGDCVTFHRMPLFVKFEQSSAALC